MTACILLIECSNQFQLKKDLVHLTDGKRVPLVDGGYELLLLLQSLT